MNEAIKLVYNIIKNKEMNVKTNLHWVLQVYESAPGQTINKDEQLCSAGIREQFVVQR
jgi:hypothetical protein